MMQRNALIVSVFAVLCGCGGSLDPVTSSLFTPPQKAAKSTLLYVSDRAAGSVLFFVYPGGTLAGTIRGLTRPESVCTDEGGHVWVGTYGNLFEYDHGGKTPIAVLKGLHHAVSGCSVDSETGNLAAVTYGARKSENGVFVFAGGRGKPTVYKSPFFTNYYSCSYDSYGNLYVTGRVHREQPNNLLAELPAGGNQLETIKVKHVFEGQAAVQWDGKYVAVLNHEHLYQFVIEGSEGKQAGGSMVIGSQAAKQFVIYGFPSTSHQRTLIAPLYAAHGEVLYWNYPNGGTSTGTLPYHTFDYPYGIAVSAGK